MKNQEERNKKYWKMNLLVLGILLCVWFLASFGAGILFSESLDEYHLGGFKLGFWFAQQGSIYVFLVLILAYIIIMNRLDKKYGVEEDDE